MTTSNTNETITHLLEQIITSVHPLMAEGLYLAAIPPWFNAEMFAAMRQRDDGRNAGLIERINRYSFVQRWAADGAATYAVRDTERRFLQRHWIANDPAAYREAHRRALAYWEAHPDPNRFAQAQNRFYHMLFVDLDAARDYLVRLFRAYHNERQLAAIERLLDTAVSARFFLAQLEAPDLETLDDLLDHLRALLAQMRGRWGESRETLNRLRQKANLSPRLRPFVVRAYAQALAQDGQFVEAVEQYELALAQFETQTETVPGVDNLAAEKAFTRLYLGDAYTGLAITARGHEDKTVRQSGLGQWFSAIFYFFLSLPLLFYLTYHLGRRVWRPRFWPVLRDLDWIIARLFALGAEQYELADPMLEEHGDPAESVAADERLAYLYLALGDVDRAEAVFRHILSEREAPLSDYRRASVKVGMGEALFRLGNGAAARDHLEAALPVLQTYEDTELQAQAEALLAETWREDADTAVTFYRRAQTHFQTVGDLVRATSVNERWRRLIDAGEDDGAGETAVAPLPQRRYRARYRHPATVALKRGIVILLAVVIFLIPLSVIRLETGAGVQPEIAFNATPLLQENRPDFTPNLSQGVSAVTLSPSPNPELLIWVGLALFAGYLILATAVGLFVLARTDVREVQAAGAAEEVGLDDSGVQIGKGSAGRSFSWEQITHFLQAGVYLGRERLIDETAAYLMVEGERPLRVSGATAWYEAICRRLADRLPHNVRRTDFTYSILRSRMGVLFGLTLLLLLALSLLGQVAADLVIIPLPAIRYSLAALYPFLYLGLFLPAIWWFVIQPLRIRRHTHPHHPLPWWLGGLGLGLLLLQVLTLFRPWLTVPDIYPSLLIITLALGALAFIWMVRDEKDEERVYAPGVRLIAAVVALVALFISGSQLWRDVRAYHYLVQGDYYRSQALQRPLIDPEDVQTAIDYYSRAITISQTPVLGIQGQSGLNIPFGIPKPDQTTWLSALNSRAALYAEQGDYEAAVADYDTLLAHTERQADVYVSRAVAYQGWGTRPGDEMGETDVDRDNYALALQDFNRAIELAPETAVYYLWRGVAYHALGQEKEAEDSYKQAIAIEGEGALDAQGQAQAYTGQGWIAYSQGDYEGAAALFQKATEAARAGAEGLSEYTRIRFASEHETLNDALLGLGYTYYSLRRYDEALEAWEQAIERTQGLSQFVYDGRPLADAIIYNSLATLYWRLGTLGDDYNVSGSDRCSAGISQEAKAEDAAELARSVQLLEQAAQIPGQQPEEIAFNYRTQGQVNYLLRNCPGYDKTETLRAAYQSYEKAVRLDPDNAHYWYRKGRLAYSVWVRPGIPDSWLEQAIADMGQAIARDEDTAVYWYDRAWMRYNQWNVAPSDAGIGARRPLFDALDDAARALELDPNARPGSYEPQTWQNIIRNEAVDGTLSRGDAFFAEGDYRKAREYYQLVATEAPDNAAAAFKTGLAALALGDEAEAQRWYETGLERAEGESAVPDLQTALLDLQTLSDTAPEATVEEPLTLLSNSDLAARAPETAGSAFALALLAVRDGNPENAAALYHQGTLLAARAGEEEAVIAAAEALAEYLWGQDEYGETAVYWPSSLERDEVYGDTADLEEPARYWRYRAQFGLSLGLDRFLDGRAAATAYNQIGADIAQVLELDPAYEIAGTFDLAFLALQRENLEEMSGRYHQGTLLAAEAGEMAPVEQAAFAWRDYLLERPELEILPRYWPLLLDPEEAEADAAELDAPDLYWRYRAEYGFEVTRKLFIERPGQEATFEQIYDQLINDVERAYEIDPDAHQLWRDFFIDANLGWHFLRRGDSYAADAYQAALADYSEATRRIQANSGNAQNDLAEATFKAGLTALRLDQPAEAERWYAQGLFLVRQYDLGGKLEQAIEQLADFGRETESPVATEILERLRTELESRQ